MDQRSPDADWRPDELEERAQLESVQEECLCCGLLVSDVSRMTCPACGDEDP